MRGVTLQQLRAFTVVAKHLAFGKAAEELCVTPPAVSMQIKELEQALGISLFNRDGAKVHLTVSGECLLFYARRALATLKDAEQVISGIKGVVHGPLSIGVVRSGSCFLPRFLSRFLEEHPCAEPRVVIASRESLIEMLECRALDLAIMGRPPDDVSIEAARFAPLRNVLAVSQDHALAGQPRLPASEIANCRFIVREEGCDTREAMERFFQMHHVRPTHAMQIGSNEAIKQAVIANLGIGFLPWDTFMLEHQAGLMRILDVQGFHAVDRWHVAHCRSHALSPMAEAFRYALLEQGKQFIEAPWVDRSPREAAGLAVAR